MYKSIICRYGGKESDILYSLDIINKDGGEIKFCKRSSNNDIIFVYEVPNYV
jgi:hypothetical protein